jgi:hypothetical protein
MLFLNFLYAAGLLALGGAALASRHLPESAQFAYNAFFFGGSSLIAGCFALQMRRHGLMTSAVLAFVALLTGLGRLFTLVTTSRPPDFSAPAFKLFTGFTILSALYLGAAVAKWRASR